DAVAIMKTLGCRIQSATVVAGAISTGEGEQAGQPMSFALVGNWPNPFDGVTRIAYALPAAAKVSLKIYNVLGEVVATVVDGIEGPGWKSVRWDASGVPAGMYFYRLKAGAFTSERKMLLV